jgi:hypothetical protein
VCSIHGLPSESVSMVLIMGFGNASDRQSIEVGRHS